MGGACARASARPMRAPLRAAGPAASWKRGLGAKAWAGRVGSSGRPRRWRRHAGAGPVAAAGRRRWTGRWSAAALRAPLHGVGRPMGVQGRGAVQGRSRAGRRRGATVWGRAGARRGAAQGCSVGLRRGSGGTACTLGGGGGGGGGAVG